ncbi:hypothetical protein CERSUDRAFT_91025 [Gelatoporia subvermispora B]|uniref:Uncharacterized protein n=1 Tax=Ceriporiopsis subvermispora (strain B) TaxID=914234 RepID=M2R797_CERS8|nr:hypothetical protein CERSUDRAFT_91025 [Gelatoporia subvermispora B]
MPAPAIYVAAALGAVAAGLAFKEFVYEPHIAPRVEAWAEAFVERRRRHRALRRGPILAQPVGDGTDEHRARRSSDSFKDKKDDEDSGDEGGIGSSLEMEELVAKEVDTWRNSIRQSTLRQRRPTSTMDQSNIAIPYPLMTPTHVLFDSSDPVTPASSNSPAGPSRAHSLPSSRPLSASNSIQATLHQQGHRLPVDTSMTTRLPTPISNTSAASSRSLTPLTYSTSDALSPRAPPSRNSTPDYSDISASHLPASIYNTALLGPGGSTAARRTSSENLSAQASERAHSPFSDAWSVGTDSSTMQSISGLTSPIAHSTSSLDDLGAHSDDDVLSLRSGMFSASDLHDDQPLSLLSPTLSRRFSHSPRPGSDDGWDVVGRRSPPEL